MVQRENDIHDSGFNRYQTYSALKKARIGYDLSNKKNNLERKKYYAWLIYKLERELGMRTTPLKEVKMLALEYYSKNHELFKQEEKGEQILKTMIEKGYTCGQPYRKGEDKGKE